MITCVIIDDEQPAIDILVRHLKKMPDLELVGTETNAATGMELIQQLQPDVVFLDIQMDEMNGLELMHAVGAITEVIYCTAYSSYAAASYEVNAVDYLMKPIAFARFGHAIERLRKVLAGKQQANIKDEERDCLYVKNGFKGKIVRLNYAEIDYVKALNNYVAFYRGKEKVVAHMNLRELEGALPAEQFMRVQKSFIVALNRVDAMEYNELIIKESGHRVPVGGSYRAELLKRMGM